MFRNFTIGFIALSIGNAGTAVAEPYVPKDNTLVLQKSSLYQYPELKTKLTHMRKAFRNESTNVALAVNLARQYISLAEKTSDPRFMGLAESTLQHWWNKGEVLTVQLLKAKIQQFNHQFEDASDTLDKIITVKPDFPAARMLRANNRLVLGDHLSAKRDCAALAAFASSLQSKACLLASSALQDDPENVRNTISELFSQLEQSESLNNSERIWTIGVLSEAALLYRQDKLAENLFQTGLEVDPGNNYLLASYADLLIRKQQYESVINLLSPFSNRLHLLVRLLYANQALNLAEFDKYSQQLLRMFEQDKASRGENHLRERAYYALYIKNNVDDALQLAKANWEKQKEVIDTVLLLEAAEKKRDTKTLDQLEFWWGKNKFASPKVSYQNLYMGV